ncbi:alpha/beta hydrolase [Lactiplantibacillus plantarum]|uniref:alpha/beta hydrolase n=1 Tax=Lactiplantibacillus plantarum TaxID=1590 RepID=UPI0021CB5083|nr:alpha/beta hydrolase [Lactiplantibacillus plantarum]
MSDKWTKQNISNLKIQRNSVTEPIVLVPGSNATQYRFDPLIRDINKREKTPHSLLRVLVHKNYTISYSGAIKKGERHGLKSIFETGFKRHSEPRLPSTAQINH